MQIRHFAVFVKTPPFSGNGFRVKIQRAKTSEKLLRRKQSSAKISKISRITLKSSQNDIFDLLRNLLKYLLRTFFSSAKFSEVFTLCVCPLALSDFWRGQDHGLPETQFLSPRFCSQALPPFGHLLFLSEPQAVLPFIVWPF